MQLISSATDALLLFSSGLKSHHNYLPRRRSNASSALCVSERPESQQIQLAAWTSRLGQWTLDLEYCPAPTAAIKVNYRWNDTTWGSDDARNWSQLATIGAFGPAAL
ncbi:hypothetical protein E4U58_001269 [Claviceps cyperi]|nr:hypothetical protein E4U58_001269 [Claviceps cyperi]